jgi:hypothetical protein
MNISELHAKELAQDYMRRKSGTIKLIDKLLARASQSIDALMANALAEELDNIGRIDRLATIAETRRAMPRCARSIDVVQCLVKRCGGRSKKSRASSK